MSQKLQVTTLFFNFIHQALFRVKCDRDKIFFILSIKETASKLRQGTLTLKILLMACSTCAGKSVFHVVGVLQKKMFVHRKLPEVVATISPG